MNTNRSTTRRTLLFVLIALLVSGCSAAQDASKVISRAAIERGAIVPAENVRVHEYLNYYEQRFPEPQDHAIGLDLRVGNTQVPCSGGEVWLQIGLQARHIEQTTRTPLNLALVLDTSGSMDSYDKMPYLKDSLHVFLASLQPDDIVAIIGYDSTAYRIRRAQPVGDGDWIEKAVNRLQPQGGTNLHGGMMMGFEEVERTFDLRRNNRVLLLTDGRANQGETLSTRIAADALAYNEKGIYLSTIGLGYDLDDDLLHTLAEQGQGAYHFIDSAQEMDKVFRQEAAGLVQRQANDVRVRIVPLPGTTIQFISGYEGRPPSSGAELQLQSMGAGDSQVVMVQMHVEPSGSDDLMLASVVVEYEDAFAQAEREIGGSVQLHTTDLAQVDPLSDIEVRRNATIVRMAQVLKEIDTLFNQGAHYEAWQAAKAMENELRRVADLAADPQMVQDADLFQRYQMTLVSALGYDPESDYQHETEIGEDGQSQRWGNGIQDDDAPLPTLDLD